MNFLPKAATALAAALCIAPPALAQDGDPVTGKGVFMNRCSQCHAVSGDQIKTGPPLTGLFGRTAGTWPGFNYSEAMRTSGIVWSHEIMAEYLVAPRTVVPGTRMNFNGLKRPGEKEDLIAYLAVSTSG